MTFAYDCRACSACCRDGSDGRIGVSAEDIERWRHIGRPDIAENLVAGHFGVQAFPARADGACIYLGTPDNPHDCSIYAIRGSVCHQLQPGEPQCRAYRRVAGLAT